MQLDFSSALYLGMKHSSQELLPWSSLTTGTPAALKGPRIAQLMSAQLAQMMGAEAGLTFPSTLHLFRDLFNMLMEEDALFFIDNRTYPISSWGLETVIAKGATVVSFGYEGSSKLKELVMDRLRPGQKAVIVSDGWCTPCGIALPLQAYLSVLKPLGGLLVLDDTQALGVLGKKPTRQMPYGFGGGGVIPWLDIKDSGVLIGSSLAKGFGVPVAVAAGSYFWMKKLIQNSLSQIHCSPPSNAEFRAMQHAFQINTQNGDHLRQLLLNNVLFFKKALLSTGIDTSGGIFPVQMLKGISKEAAHYLLDRLSENGIQAVMVKNNENASSACFILRADHTIKDIRQITDLVPRILGTPRKKYCNAYTIK